LTRTTLPTDAKIGERLHLIHVDGVPKIGDGVFIGAGASILSPMNVGTGAMISANSLVISDVPPGAFAVGVPAKAIRWSKPSNDTVAEAPTGAHARGSVGSKDN